MSTSATAVEVTTWSGPAYSTGSPYLDKPILWTLIRLFVLECELSNYPNKAFVRWLINNLLHGCAFGYVGPRFTYFANNLHSASQQPEINTILKYKCKLDMSFDLFTTKPSQTFTPLSGLGPLLKHDRGWKIIYHLSAPHEHSINDFMDPTVYSYLITQ